MSRVIKFRQWVPRLNQFVGFWGHNIDPHGAYWIGPASESESIHQQFTGLKDKNGREIYEGDIIEISGGYEGSEVDPTKARVFFKDGAFQTDFHNALIRIALPGNWLVEVVGNIYENPTLVQASSTPEGAA